VKKAALDKVNGTQRGMAELKFRYDRVGLGKGAEVGLMFLEKG
jgi:hypothetical protein